MRSHQRVPDSAGDLSHRHTRKEAGRLQAGSGVPGLVARRERPRQSHPEIRHRLLLTPARQSLRQLPLRPAQVRRPQRLRVHVRPQAHERHFARPRRPYQGKNKFHINSKNETKILLLIFI